MTNTRDQFHRLLIGSNKTKIKTSLQYELAHKHRFSIRFHDICTALARKVFFWNFIQSLMWLAIFT